MAQNAHFRCEAVPHFYQTAPYLQALHSKKAMYQTIEKELDSIREHYQVPRRTKVTNASLAVFEEEPAVVSDV